MITIGSAWRRDWPSIESLVRADQSLQQDRLPSWRDFTVVRINGVVECCCALKRYSKKLSEIRSFAFSNLRLRRLYSEILVLECIGQARDAGIYEVLVTLGTREQPFFRKMGFRPFNKQKHAMLCWLPDLEPFELEPIAGVRVTRIRNDWQWAGYRKLVRRFRTTLIQPDSKLFPSRGQCVVAVAGRRVVGGSALTQFRPQRGMTAEMGEVRGVVVDRAYRGRGIGEHLVKYCMNWAKSSGLAELLAVTDKKEWFTKLGFSRRRGSEEAWFMVVGDGPQAG